MFIEKNIVYWKMLNTGIIKNMQAQEYGRGAIQYYSTAVNYQSLLSNFLPLAPFPPIYIFLYRRNRLLLESFIELRG